MFGVGFVEWIVIGLVMVAFHIPVYRAYRRNLKDKVPPKVWAAVLLSIFPSPVGGILYTAGITPAAILFCVLMGAAIAAELLLRLPLGSTVRFYIFVMPILSGIFAKMKSKSFSVPGLSRTGPVRTCPACGAPYDPLQYSQDAVEWLCAQCHTQLPKG